MEEKVNKDKGEKGEKAITQNGKILAKNWTDKFFSIGISIKSYFLLIINRTYRTNLRQLREYEVMEHVLYSKRKFHCRMHFQQHCVQVVCLSLLLPCQYVRLDYLRVI